MAVRDFSPIGPIPTSLTTCDGGPQDFMLIPLDELAAQAAAGTLRVQLGKVCKLDDMAHRCMEENEAGSKIVVLTSFEGPTADSPAYLAKPYSRPACAKTSITDGRSARRSLSECCFLG